MTRARIALLCFCAVVSKLFAPSPAFATVTEVLNAKVLPYALSSLENTASFAVVYDPALTGNCSGGVLYIAPEDKHILASLLSAQVSGLRVHIRYQDDATAVSFGTFGWSNIHCKLNAVWINKSNY